jgi:Zn-dependent peptidase ImmA (M78 family)
MRAGAQRERYHPWRHAAELGVSVVFLTLPDGVLGCWCPEIRTIYLSPDLDQAERRSTLAHELVHAVRGDEPCATTELEIRQEAIVEVRAAELLVPLDDLASALRWCHDEAELADELWVDEAIVRTRLDNLSEDEKAFIDRALWGAEAWGRTA